MIEGQKTQNFGQESIGVSVKLSIFLSAMYASVGTFIFFLIQDEIKIFPIILIWVPLVILIAISPSIIIGFMTGKIICSLAESKIMKRLSRVAFTIMSMSICLIIALFIHILLRIKIDLSFEAPINDLSFGFLQTYPYAIGIPTIIYILAGGWFGSKIYPKFVTP